MIFLTGSALRETVEMVTKGRRALCAVAFWGIGSETLLRNADDRDIRVICNLHMGGTNPAAIIRLINAGVSVRHCPTLHAKVYIGDHDAVVTSANASVNGLGIDITGEAKLIEAGTVISADSVVSWFETLWRQSTDVQGPEDLVTSWAKFLQNHPDRHDNDQEILDDLIREKINSLSMRKATIFILKQYRKPMKVSEIALILEKYGFVTVSKSILSSVHDALRENYGEDFVRIARGVWAIASWPGIEALPPTSGQLARQQRPNRRPNQVSDPERSARIKDALSTSRSRGVALGAPRLFTLDKHKQALELRAAGWTYQRIADELGFSVITIKRNIPGKKRDKKSTIIGYK